MDKKLRRQFNFERKFKKIPYTIINTTTITDVCDETDEDEMATKRQRNWKETKSKKENQNILIKFDYSIVI